MRQLQKLRREVVGNTSVIFFTLRFMSALTAQKYHYVCIRCSLRNVTEGRWKLEF